MTTWTNPLADPRDRRQTDVLLSEGHAALVRKLLNGGRTAAELERQMDEGRPADPILVIWEGWKP